ncbi:MAG: hypothetical protein KF684_07475 [Phycisphaeraceae bacterium]|nr:hypothetical protein [Phycisphaeraceae bacterium]
MSKHTTVAIASLLTLVGAAHAAPTIEFLPPGFLVTDLSLDGTIGCGNVQGDGSFETFRWQRGVGITRLGFATVPVLGIGAGSPDISYDGTRISATILSSNNLQTQGVWDHLAGWTETMPPLPPNGVIRDNSYGSAWGLSGDGETVVGFFWGTNGRSWASAWSSTTGMVHLPQTLGRSARVDAASFDGSVVGGWEDAGGPRLPTVWRNGVKIILSDGNGGGGGGVWGINHDGSVLVGFEFDDSVITRVPTIWTWNGASYDMQNLAYLPGTAPSFGQSYLATVSDDGQLAGGSNIFTQSPGGARVGIIWTPSTGVIDAMDYFAMIGVADQIPANVEIREITTISPDGGTISGIALLNDTFEFQSFVISLNATTPCPGDTNGDGVVNFADLNTVLGSFGLAGDAIPGDVNDDGVVNFSDLNIVLANFGAVCR